MTIATHRAEPATRPADQLTVVTVELGPEFMAASVELSEIAQVRAEADAREKQLKKDLIEASGAEVLPNHQYLVVVDGILRHKIAYQSRDGVDAKALQAAFPEAYEATKTTSEFLVVRKA